LNGAKVTSQREQRHNAEFEQEHPNALASLAGRTFFNSEDVAMMIVRVQLVQQDRGQGNEDKV
jgi:hypothetical protein